MSEPEAVRKMPRRTTVIDFTEDGYPDFHATRWVNAPMRAERAPFEATEEAASREAHLELWPEWDFVDYDGDAIPHTPEGFDEIPAGLFGAMVRRGMEAVREAGMPAPLSAPSSPEGGRAARKKT
jgi:hypothetical protein